MSEEQDNVQANPALRGEVKAPEEGLERMPSRNEVTLKELLRPGLRVVFVGINPAPISVKLQHYYQGQLGKRFWRRLHDYGLLTELPEGREDEVAFSQGLGFADVVRRPTRRAHELSRQEIQRGVLSLVQRLQMLGEPLPVIVFVFKTAEDAAAAALQSAGFKTFRMPGPYVSKAEEKQHMEQLARQLAFNDTA